jgi:hypothetical protein
MEFPFRENLLEQDNLAVKFSILDQSPDCANAGSKRWSSSSSRGDKRGSAFNECVIQIKNSELFHFDLNLEQTRSSRFPGPRVFVAATWA